MEVIADFAHELPIRLICETLGVPEVHQEAFSGWSTDLGRALSSVLTPDLRTAGEATAVALSEAIRDLLQERRRSPADDLLSGLIRAADDLPDRFSDEDLVVLVLATLEPARLTRLHLRVALVFQSRLLLLL